MKSASASTAKILLLLLPAIALVSGFVGQRWARELDDGARAIRAARASQSQAESNLASLQKLLPGNETAQPIDAAVAHTLLAIQAPKTDARVTIASVLPEGASRGKGGTGVVPNRVGDTNLMAVSLEVHGSYADYEGLLSYLRAVRKEPISLTRLKIDNANFQFSVTVFGHVG